MLMFFGNNSMKEPVFLRESNQLSKQIEKLKELEPSLNEEGKTLLRQDIKNLEYGIIGEKNIAFELKNSHMPMYILHDIYLEDGELNAQIDYMVFTRKLCFVIECKNLYGNIEINNQGDFIRTMEFGKIKKREGIYSPITQNQRHLELMKKLKTENKNNGFIKFFTNKYFYEFTKPVVVLANPKTILDDRYAKKEVKEKVIRADKLVDYIKELNKNCKELESNDKDLLRWAESYLNMHKEKNVDFTLKYEKYKNIEIENTDIFKALKFYRLQKSREENIKPYFICNDLQLKDLISKMPSSKEELKLVSGFGDVKVDKYGEDIIQIMSKFRL